LRCWDEGIHKISGISGHYHELAKLLSFKIATLPAHFLVFTVHREL
jgi:hypothetical protein